LVVLAYAYLSMFTPILIIVFAIISSVLFIISIVLTIYLVELEIYPKQFGLFVNSVIFHIFLMRFIPLNAIWIYVISFILSFVIWLLLYEIKPLLDTVNPVKLSKSIVITFFGLLVFVTMSFYYENYVSFFYDQIQVKPQMNMSLFYTVTQETNHRTDITIALDEEYTYIQILNKLIVVKDNKIIHEMEIPDNHQLLASKDDIVFAFYKGYNSDDIDNLPYEYDIYQFNSNFTYNKTKSIKTQYKIYGFFKYNAIDYYIGSATAILFEDNNHLKNINLFQVLTNNRFMIEPIFDGQILKGIGIVIEDEVIPLPSTHYSHIIPWIEHIDDRLISSFSWQDYSRRFIVIDPISLDPIASSDSFSSDFFSYLKKDDYHYILSFRNLDVYDSNGIFIENISTIGKRVIIANQNIYISINTLSKNYDQLTSQIYIINQNQPVIYKTSSEFSFVNIIFVIGFTLAYILVDRRKIIEDVIVV